MSVFNRPASIHVTCAKLITPYLADELVALGFPVLAQHPAGVETEGSLADAMWLNLNLRTGLRVLYLLSSFSATDPDDLYEGTFQISWEEYLDPDGYLSVVSAVDTESITNTQFANVRCKDGIVDRMVKTRGRRPDSGPQTDRTVVFLYWKGSSVSIYLDTSGEPLSRRGYRRIPFKAPMAETLAATVILATDWDGASPFVNPMCGSGTLAIEAALIALGRAPGMQRENFAFMHLNGFDPKHWESMRKKAKSTARRKTDAMIITSDISPDAVIAARKNAVTAGVDHLITFETCDFARTTVPAEEGVVLINPEYGERLGNIRQLERTYERIGDFFKQECAGYTGYIFTGNLELAKRIGLRTKRRMPFYNGSIECRLLEYELYSGSKRPESPFPS